MTASLTTKQNVDLILDKLEQIDRYYAIIASILTEIRELSDGDPVVSKTPLGAFIDMCHLPAVSELRENQERVPSIAQMMDVVRSAASPEGVR